MKELSGGKILRGCVKNEVSAETLAVWLEGLGEFDRIDPVEAAARWGIRIRDALTRLHLMVGANLRIPRGCVETYEILPPVKFPPDPLANRPPAELREERLAKFPDAGATVHDLSPIWGLSIRSTSKALGNMLKMGLVDYGWRGGTKFWRKK